MDTYESQRLLITLRQDLLDTSRLPDPSTSPVDQFRLKGRTVAGEHVIVTFERYRYKHHKFGARAWRMLRARIDPDGRGRWLP